MSRHSTFLSSAKKHHKSLCCILIKSKQKTIWPALKETFALNTKPTVAQKKLGTLLRGRPPLSLICMWVAAGGGGGGRSPLAHECNFHAPVEQEVRAVVSSKIASGARALCKPGALSWTCGQSGPCEWVSAAKSRHTECGGGVLSLDTIAADPPVLIRARGLPWRAQAHSLTLARSPPARGAYCCCFRLRPSSGFRTLLH